MHDVRDRPLEPEKHTDQISYITAGTDHVEETDHADPYTEDAVFKGMTGPVRAQPLNHSNHFWVLK